MLVFNIYLKYSFKNNYLFWQFSAKMRIFNTTYFPSFRKILFNNVQPLRVSDCTSLSILSIQDTKNNLF